MGVLKNPLYKYCHAVQNKALYSFSTQSLKNCLIPTPNLLRIIKYQSPSYGRGLKGNRNSDRFPWQGKSYRMKRRKVSVRLMNEHHAPLLIQSTAYISEGKESQEIIKKAQRKTEMKSERWKVKGENNNRKAIT